MRRDSGTLVQTWWSCFFFSGCFHWNVVSQPSVSPLCDLINECWAVRLDPLWGGHIWTLFTHTVSPCRALSLPSSISCFSSLSLLLCPSSAFPFSARSYHLCFLLILFFITFLCHPHSVLFSFSCPLCPPLFPAFHLCMASSPLHGGQALLSPFPPQEPLTSAGCCAKVVPLSLPAGAGSFVPRMFKHRSGKRKHCDINNTAFKMAETYA